MLAKLIFAFLLIACIAGLTAAGGGGTHHKKVIIHVPVKIHKVHHTHTIYKHVGKHDGGDDKEYYKVIGYSGGVDQGKVLESSGGHEGHAEDLKSHDFGNSFEGGFGGGHASGQDSGHGAAVVEESHEDGGHNFGSHDFGSSFGGGHQASALTSHSSDSFHGSSYIGPVADTEEIHKGGLDGSQNTFSAYDAGYGGGHGGGSHDGGSSFGDHGSSSSGSSGHGLSSYASSGSAGYGGIGGGSHGHYGSEDEGHGGY